MSLSECAGKESGQKSPLFRSGQRNLAKKVLHFVHGKEIRQKISVWENAFMDISRNRVSFRVLWQRTWPKKSPFSFMEKKSGQKSPSFRLWIRNPPKNFCFRERFYRHKLESCLFPSALAK
ncbi:hypothetical protein KKD49_18880, partial [Myxococcota bacterium]|nr:hypothetical protein [Myxococcota bacterium]